MEKERQTKIELVKRIVKDYGKDLPMALYLGEPVIFKFEGFRNNRVMIGCYSEYSGAMFQICI